MSPVHGRAPGLGILLVLVMGACFAAMDTTVKLLGAIVPVLVILWARYGVQAASMGVWLVVSRRRGGEVVYSISVPEVRDLLLAARTILSGLIAVQGELGNELSASTPEPRAR